MRTNDMILQCWGMGTVMGTVHVLTGPDHLSALATISSNTETREAFVCGIRWGCGHSFGVIVVGLFFIVLSYYRNHDDDNNDNGVDIPAGLELVLEWIVGICMLSLGCYGVVTAVRSRSLDEECCCKNNDNSAAGGIFAVSNANNNDTDGGADSGAVGEKKCSYGSTAIYVNNNYCNSDSKEWGTSNNEDDRNNNNNGTTDPLRYDDDGQAGDQEEDYYQQIMMHHDDHTHKHEAGKFEKFIYGVCPQRCLSFQPSKKLLSVCIGIVHGVAGPGGVLGVIPAVQLHDWLLSTVYLGSFAATSTIVMGIFASTYATCTTKFSNGKSDMQFKINLFSSSLSLIVGSLWLSLLVVGKLHDVFP